MGRDCGDLALYTALACGAEAAIIPEVKWSVEKLGDMVHRGVVSGKRSMILVFAEGASRSMVESLDELEAKYPKLHIFGDRILSDQLAEIVEEVSGHETRATVLGYTQRGGSPTANDRILATRTGAYAVKLLSQDIGGRAVGVKGSDLINVPIEDCMKGSTFDPELYELVGVTGYIKK